MMLSPSQAILLSWTFPPVVTALNLLAALLYLRGWLALRSMLPEKFAPWRAVSFFASLATLQIALASPIDAFDAFFLTDHMIQHLLLMMVVPPLVLVGNPGVPMMRGLPRVARRAVGWLLKHPPVSWIADLISRPALCWLLFTVAMLGWHLPRPYDLALRSSAWHEAEHATFFLTSILFWWPVIQPWPSHARWPRWSLIPYLLLADFANSGLCAFLVFSGRIFYPFYLQLPRIYGLSVENDQVIAGAVMWAIGSLAFLIPAVAIAVNLLSPSRPGAAARRGPRSPATSMRRIILPTLICLLPLAALGYGFGPSDSVDIDGDVPLMHAAGGQLIVTVFAPPQPLSTGSNDLAVLIQDMFSREPISDASVELSATCNGEFTCETQASPRPAANRLLKAATLNFSKPGSWDVTTLVRSGDREFVLHSTVEVKSIVSQR
ncbi:MAG TPA: cytochrome c oxidase assembly protein [Candidatus Acidoferrales bacterium]|nr:cytochrome c oxidase assembly protein [Candidatus Acidoferrales bacterium]